MDGMISFIKIAYCLGTSSLKIFFHVNIYTYFVLFFFFFFVATEYSKVHNYTVINKFTIRGHLVSIFILVVIIIKKAAKDIAVHMFFCTCPGESSG